MKKMLSLILCIFLLFSFTGCIEVDKKITRNTIIDGSGAVLDIMDNRENLTIASVYAVSVPFLTALELTDRVKAINLKSRFWADACDDFASVGSVGRGTVDLEALAQLSPDVLIHRTNDASTVEAVNEKLKIPVICIKAENFSDILYTLNILGEYFGCEERAEVVSSWLKSKFELIDEVTKNIPENVRVTACVMGSQPGRVAGGDMLQSWMIEKAGGICVVSDIENNKNWVNIGTEKMFILDPQVLFCTSSSPLEYSVEGILKDNTWSAMQSVKNNDIYVIPSAIDSWDLPGVSCVIGTMYMLYKMYPEYFSLQDLQKEIDDYYIFMFGRTFDANYLGYELVSNK